MNIWLLNKEREFDSKESYLNKNDMIKDLNLEAVFRAMAKDNKEILSAVQTVAMVPLMEDVAIRYRQDIIADCLKNTEQFTDIFRITSQAQKEILLYKENVERKRKSNGSLSKASSIFESIEILLILVRNLETLKDYMDNNDSDYISLGMKSFCARMREYYNVTFVEEIKTSIREMVFLTKGGRITLSATLGHKMKGNDIVVNTLIPVTNKKNKSVGGAKSIYYKMFKPSVILLNEPTMIRDAQEIEDAGLLHILKMYQGFIQELQTFFQNLQFQISFYVGCANLSREFKKNRIPQCMPKLNRTEKDKLEFKDLVELSLGLSSEQRPVGNDLTTDDKCLYVITGANQGGKSTYLRGVGIAQVMMQCGMFVPAEYYVSSLFRNIYTHFTRREDCAMNSGRLEEELKRMDRIIGTISKDSMVLLNESFASTTEKEGAMIAKEITTAFYEAGISVLMVTHLFKYSKEMYEKQLDHAIFLSAERQDDGTRTFKIIEAEPTHTSYGLDLYEEIMGND